MAVEGRDRGDGETWGSRNRHAEAGLKKDEQEGEEEEQQLG